MVTVTNTLQEQVAIKGGAVMAITPFKKVTSREIFGADISGLQDAVNKVEAILEMQTAVVTGHLLHPVTDQAEPALHRRIYEGTIRNWLEEPAPIIKRDDQVVPPEEYTLFAAQGMVVFNQQQAMGVIVTADFTHIRADSPFVGHVGSGGGVHALASDTTAGFMSTTDKLLLSVLDYKRYRRSGLYHFGVSSPDMVTAAVTVDTFDAIPFYTPVTQSFDRIAVGVTVAGAAGTRVRMGVYANLEFIYPGALILDAGEVAVDVTGERFLPITLTLTPGLYWLVHGFNGTPTTRVIPGSALIPLGYDLLQPSVVTGFRLTQSYALGLPNPFSGGAPMLLSGRRGIFLRRA